MFCSVSISENGCFPEEFRLSKQPNFISTLSFKYEDVNIILLFEGLVLNEEELLHKYCVASLETLICLLYNTRIDSLSTELYGEFAIAIYNKEAKTLHVQNDLLSKKSVFYMNHGKSFTFSTSFFELCDYAKENNAPLTVDEIGTRMMIYSGAFYEEYTYFKEVRWLVAFRYISVFCVPQLIPINPVFDTYSATEYSSEEVLIEKIHELFSEGCRYQCRVNQRYGCKQVFTLSGGMDSRAVLLTAMESGFLPDITFTCAESGSLDQIIATNVAEMFGIQHYFYSLNGGNFIKRRDAIIGANEGQMYYAGATGCYDTIESLDLSNSVVIHTGCSGGEVMGDICSRGGESNNLELYLRLVEKLRIPNKEHARELAEKFSKRHQTYNEFENVNDVRRCLNFAKTASVKVYAISPFLYEPFFAFVSSVPYAMKEFRNVYRKWYRSKFVIGIRTTSENINIEQPLLRRIANIVYRVKSRTAKEVTKITKKKNQYDMNPMQLWMDQNPRVKEYIEQTHRNECDLLALKNTGLSRILDDAYNGNIDRKLSCLTAECVYKKYLL